MFLLKGLMTQCLLATINLLEIGNLCIFGIQNGAGSTFLFFGMEIEKYCLISFTVELIKLFLFIYTF